MPRLNAQPGFDTDVGGPTLASTLIEAGLVDVYRVVHPAIRGAGTPFFRVLSDRPTLKLLKTQTLDAGVVYLRYETVSPAE